MTFIIVVLVACGLFIVAFSVALGWLLHQLRKLDDMEEEVERMEDGSL